MADPTRAELDGVQAAVAQSNAQSSAQIEDLNSQLERVEKERDELRWWAACMACFIKAWAENMWKSMLLALRSPNRESCRMLATETGLWNSSPKPICN